MFYCFAEKHQDEAYKEKSCASADKTCDEELEKIHTQDTACDCENFVRNRCERGKEDCEHSVLIVELFNVIKLFLVFFKEQVKSRASAETSYCVPDNAADGGRHCTDECVPESKLRVLQVHCYKQDIRGRQQEETFHARVNGKT